jgi:hypothetical protein
MSPPGNLFWCGGISVPHPEEARAIFIARSIQNIFAEGKKIQDGTSISENQSRKVRVAHTAIRTASTAKRTLSERLNLHFLD